MSTGILPVDAEVVNEKTGEVVSFPEPAGEQPTAFQSYYGAGTLVLTENQSKVLTEQLPDEAHSILPTGEVYVSQVHVRRKLARVFGPGGWSLVPISPFTTEGNTICREYMLVCLGRFVAQAIGEADYQPHNARMSYASACEGAKSSALTRCAKDLLIASECWEKRYTERFKAEFCVKVWREKVKNKKGGEGEFQWRLADAEPFYDEKGTATPKRKPQAPPQERKLDALWPDDDQTVQDPPAKAEAPKAKPSPKPATKVAEPVQATPQGDGPGCPMCGTPGKPQRWAKPGKSHFCPSCAHAWAPEAK